MSMPLGDVKASALTGPAPLAKYDQRDEPHLGEQRQACAFVVVAVSEDAVGPLLAQQEKQKVIQVVAL